MLSGKQPGHFVQQLSAHKRRLPDCNLAADLGETPAGFEALFNRAGLDRGESLLGAII